MRLYRVPLQPATALRTVVGSAAIEASRGGWKMRLAVAADADARRLLLQQGGLAGLLVHRIRRTAVHRAAAVVRAQW